jgi:hypothetical protein
VLPHRLDHPLGSVVVTGHFSSHRANALETAGPDRNQGIRPERGNFDPSKIVPVLSLKLLSQVALGAGASVYETAGKPPPPGPGSLEQGTGPRRLAERIHHPLELEHSLPYPPR